MTRVWKKKKQASTIETGLLGELYAKKYLRSRGYKIITQNWRCRIGEIDIVAKEGRELVIVEVKTRIDGEGVEELLFANISKKKRQKLQTLAEHYLRRNFPGRFQPAVRIDVIGVVLQQENLRLKTVDHLLAAI